MKKHFYIIIFILFTVVRAIAQLPDIAQKMKEKYPEALAVQLEDKMIVEITINQSTGVPDITQKVYEKQLYLTDRASLFAEREITFNSFMKIQNRRAVTYSPQNGKYKAIKVKEFVTKEELGGSTFKDDTRILKFRYPALKKGAISELYYEETLNEPRFLSSFYFGNYRPVEHAYLEYIVDQNIEIDFKQFNTETINLQFKQFTKKGKTHYIFEAKNIPEFDKENDAPSIRYYVPHIIPIIRQYTYKEKEIPVLRNVADLYRWYAGLIKNVNKTESPALKAITDSLIQGKTSDIEKVKAIYYWVQNNIKYVAFEEGLGGFVPREAAEVCSKRYGDCKDNTSILVEMMKYAGINAYFTWIGTRSIPYSYEEVPTPVADNHMIATVILDTNYYFLDATGNYHPLGLPSAFIQGKEALIGLDSLNYEIIKVPIVLPKQNAYYDSLNIHLNNLTVEGNGHDLSYGYLAVDSRYELQQLKNEKERKEYVKQFSEKGSNKYFLTNYEIIDKAIDAPLELTYSFKIEDYVQAMDDELYINLNLEREAIQLTIKDTKKYDKEFDNTIYTKTIVEFQIPDGYHVAYLPENSSMTNDILGYDITYTQSDNKIIYTHSFEIKKILVKKEQFPQWNNVIKQITKQYKEVVVLKKL